MTVKGTSVSLPKGATQTTLKNTSGAVVCTCKFKAPLAVIAPAGTYSCVGDGTGSPPTISNAVLTAATSTSG